jgi:hypothetical protein
MRGRGKQNTMKGISRVAVTVLLAGAGACAAGALAGCHGQHPDRRNAIYQALNQHHMDSVEVFQDQDHGVITLKGIVGNAGNKTQAAQLVQQLAPGYTVNNQLTVDTTGLMSMANPNAKPPQLEQMAHAPGSPANPAAKAERQQR